MYSYFVFSGLNPIYDSFYSNSCDFSDRTISMFENKGDRLPVSSFAESFQLTMDELVERLSLLFKA
ncbi:hypothetical protein APA_5032 [Pseudanabaena sp. lw0831]|nr:hypothetical protein APA_5032 [Pseudanabaena sp. lw0831]